jgi:iron(II)-dependent oxidoreductase
MLRAQTGLRRRSATGPDLLREAFARSVIRGLGDTPRWLSCRYLYDHYGSEIFEHITEQPEYYPTRTESGILAREAARIFDACAGTTLVELGAGSATKTRHLLRAWTARGRRATYVPIDISRSMLAQTSSELRREFPRLAVESIAGSYEQAMPALRDLSPLTLVFLGSSVGNFNEEELDEFLTLLSSNLSDGDRFLLGIDLVKETSLLEAAYNDAAGWSAQFTLNLFARMNRELGTTLDVGAIEHVANWNGEKSRIDIWARFLRDQVVDLPEWGQRFTVDAGEKVLVEISRKFRVEDMTRVAARHGFELDETFTDPAQHFALLLLRRRVAPGAAVEARREKLRVELERQRSATLEILAPLDREQLTRQHCALLSPVVWDLGHIASYEREWAAKAAGAAPAPEDSVVAQLYDPILHPRSVRGSLPLVDPERCIAGLEDARVPTMELLATADLDSDDPLLRDGYVFSLIAQHEAQHSETILQSVQLLPELGDVYLGHLVGFANKVSQVNVPEVSQVNVPAFEECFVPAGPFTMGTDDRSVAYDNERPAHVVELPSYWIDAAPVTNGDFLRFVEDRGYRRRSLWTADGWRWLAESKAEHPSHWRRAKDGSWTEHSFGRLEPLNFARPVIHISWYEADACARWLGKRLPTEAEWEKAAAWDLERAVPRLYPWGDSSPDEERANLDQRTFAPAEVGTLPRGRSYFGCHQMIGDVWEWTSSDFLPYPGFRVFPYAEYSQVHFGSRYKVLRGGAWSTPRIAIRNTFRNWDLPQRRQIFAGLRCARD